MAAGVASCIADPDHLPWSLPKTGLINNACCAFGRCRDSWDMRELEDLWRVEEMEWVGAERATPDVAETVLLKTHAPSEHTWAASTTSKSTEIRLP